ncbi:MAG: hypothetical protein OXB88_11300 [Bacteriovoracales bacterium]|nr:hypothetical protein [Bacteriovoracales bacterium]
MEKPHGILTIPWAKWPILLLTFLWTFALWGAEDHLYDFRWLDPNKKVYVLQNKIYKRRHTFFSHVGWLSGLTSNFQEVTGIQGAFGFYIGEEWALELSYHQLTNTDNQDMKNLKIIEEDLFPFIRKIETKKGLTLLFSPFYGKINLFNKIIYFDWSFGLGLDLLDTTSNAKTVAIDTAKNMFETRSLSSLLAKTSLRIYLSRTFYTGMEFHRNYYQAEGPHPEGGPVPADQLRYNDDLIFFFGVSF